MPCYFPIRAFRCTNGDVVFNELRRYDISSRLDLPCGQCIGCRLERSRQWAVRIVHESRMHSSSCFVTLSYSPENLPPGASLRYRDVQLFLKRLRKHFRCRFFVCGEYGDCGHRPHYHACLFGVNFADKKYLAKSDAGSVLYRSALLEKLWPLGFSSIGELNFESAAYAARYCVKKVTGPNAESHYRVVDVASGEFIDRVPEFAKMSLKPGIGAEWYARFSADVYPRDMVLSRSVPSKPPRFYDKVLKRCAPDVFDEVVFARALRARDFTSDNTDERLAVKAVVAKSRLAFYSKG